MLEAMSRAFVGHVRAAAAQCAEKTGYSARIEASAQGPRAMRFAVAQCSSPTPNPRWPPPVRCMPRYDLHCHSTRSDGLLAPAAVVARAAPRGVDVLALTDHDEVSRLGRGDAMPRARLGIRFVCGSELSVSWEDLTHPHRRARHRSRQRRARYGPRGDPLGAHGPRPPASATHSRPPASPAPTRAR